MKSKADQACKVILTANILNVLRINFYYESANAPFYPELLDSS